MLKRYAGVAGVVCCLGLTVSACGASAGGAGSAPAAAKGGDVTVGVDAELTGPGNVMGVPEGSAIKVAVQEVNASGSLGKYKLRTDVADDGTDPTQAVTAFNKFASQHVPVVIESAYSSILQALAPFAARDKLPVISAGSAGFGPQKPGGYVFRMADQTTGEATLVKALTGGLGKKRFAYIFDDDNPGFKTIIGAFKGALSAAGGTVTAQVGVASADTDLATQISKLTKTSPQVIMTFLAPNQAGQFIREATQAGVNASVVIGGYDGYGDSVAQIGGPRSNVIFPQPWVPRPSQPFVQAYKRLYHAMPTSVYGAMAHDAIWLIGAAVADLAAEHKSITGENLQGAFSAAARSALFREHALIKGFAMSPAGVPTYPSELATFKGNATVPCRVSKAAGGCS